MANKQFGNFESLALAVEGVIPKILIGDVAPVAEDILKEHIKSDIYDAYTPKPGAWVSGTYDRRHVLESSIISIMTRKDTMTVTSSATASPSVVPGSSFKNRYPGAFLQLIESGNTGIWRGGFARPAVHNTQDEINTSPRVERAIRDGIRQRIE